MADSSLASKTFKTLHGTLLAGTTGFALGGPLGALIGTALGAAYDRTRQALFAVEDIVADLEGLDAAPEPAPQLQASNAQEAAFTIGVIALGAKLARLGKKLDRETLEQFRAAFRLPPADIPLIRRMFEQALFDSVGHRPYAEQLKQVFAGNTLLLEALLQGLARFAKDGQGAVALPVLEYLASLATQFGVAPGKLEEILRKEGVARAPSNAFAKRQTAWDILGVSAGAPEITVKQAYRALVVKCHPDRLRADNDDAAALAAANDKMAALNAAYAEIKKSRGWA